MKKITDGKFFQKIITILLIFVMLSSYLPMLVVFAEDTSESDYADKIALDVNWQGGDTNTTGTTADTYTLEYNLKFNGVPTGFKNVQMYIKTDKINNVSDSVTAKSNSSAEFMENGTYSYISFGDKNTGLELGGSASVKFGNDGEQHERKVLITVVGKYIDSNTNEEVSFKVEKSLNASITPATQITNYEAILKMQTGKYGNELDSYVYGNEISMGNGEYGSLGWYSTIVTARYPIHIDSYTYTEKLDLNITINRLCGNESKLSEGYTINWDGLDSVLGIPTETTNENGSITYTFSKGEDSEKLVKDNTFSINKDFTIVITYSIPNSNPEAGGELREKYTNCTFLAEMKSIGYKTESIYGKEETQEKIVKTSSLNKNNSVGLSLYTPGTHAWISVKFGTINNSYLDQEDMQNFVENRNIDLSIRASINEVNGVKDEGLVGDIVYEQPKITYLSDEGKIVTKTLTANEMRLKSIKEFAGSKSVSEFWDGSTYTEFNGEYSIEDEKNVNTFRIKMNNYLYNSFSKFDTTYTLNANELGLSDTELANILTISINTYTNGQWCYGNGTTSFYNTNSIGNKYSYMEMNIGEDFSSDVSKKNVPESKNITLKMYKNTWVMKTNENYVINENPVFYVNLPSGFKYKNIDINITENSSISIDENNLDIIRINGEKYLVIPCLGVYDSKKLDEVDINISFTRTLENNANVGDCTIYAYMLTDNERYIYEQTNTLGLSKGEVTPEKVFATSASFNISGSKEISAMTRVGKTEEDTVEPNPSDDVITKTEKACPMIIDSGDEVVYQSELSCQDDTLKNIKIISKLPIANNTYIDNPDSKLIEDDYKLPDSFYEKYINTIRGFNKGDIITQVSLQNVNNIKVYCKNMSNGNQETIGEDNYTIYYTTQENVNFETDETVFVEYVKGESDLSQARNLKVVFNDTYRLISGYKMIVQYEMTMPDEAGMIGAVTAAQYTKSANTNPTTLYSPAAYVINGNTNGSIVVNKKFEGYNVGIAPSGVSLSGIEFKLQYYDEEEGTKKFLQDSTGADIVATTNENGVATFSNIPYGEYYLYEVTEFNSYSGIGNLQIINLEAGQTVNYIAENKLKRGNITIHKEWEDTNEQQGSVKFTIQRVNKSGENVTFKPITVTTDETGVAVAENIPYGTYKITETSGKGGWYASSQNVVLNAENKDVTFKNVLAKANSIQIVKTVPEGETVDGLKFHITSIGKVNYINKEGKQIDTSADLTITVGEDYSSVDNINVIKVENDTKAIITISNLYLGAYTIEEIDIPIIEGTNIEKYVNPSPQYVNLNTMYQTEQIILKNNYKIGTLEIQKTAKLKEGDTYTDIGDLSSFKVHITGTSYYGHEVDKIITLDENGHGGIRLEIGNYKVTEVAEDGYTTYYGENNQASTTPPTVTIEYNKTTTQKLYNEHTGVGYVRVEKTLEGKTDPQKVIDAGIEFKVVGQNVAGGRVEETIKIDKIDTEKNVAYGVSGPISSGGEYQLEEVESTVPEFFEGIEPVEVDLKTSHTTEAPLVIKAENKRTKGNLEILTQTDPVGGPLVGITYRVTEVEINKNGTYTKIGGSVEVAGNNDDINPSFAEMKDINAGYYLVEQLTVPKGWQKDVSQIVEVPSYNTGYANFEITAIKKLQQNKVKINKIILNSQGEIATEEDLEKAELNKNESFEIKLTNVDTKEIFYVFTSTDEPGVIQGLEPGTYKIEEIYKPKYITEGYYNNIEVEPNDIQGLAQNIENTIVEERIIETDGEYLFTIEQNGNSIEDVELTIKNKINTSFGFGGQTLVDNLSKVDVQEQEIQIVTKAVIYVVDENNNAISGVKFKLVNEQGKVIVLNNKGAEFEISDKKMTIKGLPVGKYTLVCTQYPDGYLKPDDKEIIVYSDAVQVARVEIQKNIPRGTMLLSTVYTTEDNETKYTSRSKYKVVNQSTGELVKFTRTATGDYKKSNLDDASPVIVLKSGPVEIEGIEAGDYEVGIVDVTKGYGIQSELPENVTIEENVTENVSVEVINKEIVQVAAGRTTSMYLNESGELFIVGYDSYGYGVFGNDIRYSANSQFTKIDAPILKAFNVKFSKFSYNDANVVAIDTEGRVWSWGYNSYGQLGTGSSNYYYTSPYPVTEGPLHNEYYNEGTKFVDVQVLERSTLLLDNKGRVWVSGYNLGDGTYNSTNIYQNSINAFLQQDIKIKKLGKCIGNNLGVIDSLGRVWIWSNYYSNVLGSGSRFLTPVCYSNMSDMKNVEIEDLVVTETYAMALDSNGEIWLWGTSDIIESEILQGTKSIPTKVDSSFFGNAKIKLISGTSTSSNSTGYVAVVDEFGRVWTWGNGTNGEIGNGECVSSSVPICISDDETDNLYGVEIKDIAEPTYYDGIHIVAVDSNNRIWSWGGKSTYYQSGNKSDTPISTPRIVTTSYNEHLDYNVRFKEVFTGVNSNNYDCSYAIDEEGKVWIWGNNRNNQLGIYNNDQSILSPIILNIPGNPRMKKVSSYNASTIMLSEDGRVFICGSPGYTGDGKSIGTSIITEITENFSMLENEKIVDVLSTGGVFVALDSKGKVYTWGGSSSLLGRPKNDTMTIKCISDDSEVLKGVKIAKLNYTGVISNDITALDSEGNLYVWGYSSATPKRVDILSGTKFADIKAYYLLDKNGKIWTIDSRKGDNIICRSNDAKNPLYKNHEIDKDYKIINMYISSSNYSYGNTDYTSAILKDSNGDLWVYKGNESNVIKLEGEVDVGGYTVIADLMPKDIISLSDWLLVDKYGQIWVYKNIGNYYGQAGIGSNVSIVRPRCLAGDEQNMLYNVKMKKLFTNKYATDEKGNLYSVINNGGIVGISPIEYMEGTLGIKIVDSCGYEGTSGDIQKIAIDENGKLWEGDSKEVKCLSDLTGTQLAEKYENDSDFRIEKIYQYGYGKYNTTNYAIDNSGKLWAWGNNRYGLCGNGTTKDIKYPVCISDIEGSDLNNIETIEVISNSVIAKDNNGKVWTWGRNNNGQCGDGTTDVITQPYCINTQKLDGKSIKEIKMSETYGTVLCTDGSVYISANTRICSTTDWTYVGTCEGANKIVKNGNLYIICGENKVWTFGLNNYSSGSLKRLGLCGTGDSTNDYITTPTLISEEFAVDKIVSGYIFEYIIDTNGKVWHWGGASGSSNVNVVGPVCSDNSNKVLDFISTSSNGSIATIDENGIIKYINSDTGSDMSKVIKEVYGELNKENILKLADIINENKGGTVFVVEKGKMWELEICYADEFRHGGYRYVKSYRCRNTNVFAGKYIVDYRNEIVLDSEGKIYDMSNNAVPVCITNKNPYRDAVFKANGTVINAPKDNDLYGVKIKELVNDKFAIDENDNIWYFTKSGKPTNLSAKYQGDKNPLYGKEISEVINNKYVVTTDNKIWYIGGDYPGYAMEAMSVECEYICKYFEERYGGYEFYIALDKNGKIWSCGTNPYGSLGNGGYTTGKKPVCLNDIEGTELYNAHEKDSDFRIEKIVNGINSNDICRTFIALDNSGKVWSWGYNRNGYCGNGNTDNVLSPICISDIEGTELCNAYKNGITMKLEGNKLYDSNGNYWGFDSDTNTFKQASSSEFKGTGDLAVEINNNPDFEISKKKGMSTYHNDSYGSRYLTEYFVIGNNGKVYIDNYNNEYTVIDNLTGIKDVYESYSSKSNSRRYNKYIAYGNDGVFEIVQEWSYDSKTETTTIYSVTVNKVATCNIIKAIQVADSRHGSPCMLALDDTGKIWAGGYLGDKSGVPSSEQKYSYYSFICLSTLYDEESYLLSGKVIKDIDMIGNQGTYSGLIIVFAEDSQGNLYAWDGIANSTTPVLFTAYDETIKKLYGEVNNETRKEFALLLAKNDIVSVTSTNIALFQNETSLYKLQFVDSVLTCTENPYTEDEFIGGIGKIVSVVGEDEIQTSDGTIYKLESTNMTEFTIEKTEKATPFKELEIEPVEIEDVNIIKQTKYKALDDKGNLYVWDNYCGLSSILSGIVCLTNEQYYVKPIYSRTNGWSVIKNQF